MRIMMPEAPRDKSLLSASRYGHRKVITMYFRTATAALAITIGLSGFAHAEIVEGTVSAVTADGQLQITLPSGARVAQGDSVEVLADIPGLGPVAISTTWTVTGTSAGTVTALPEGTPSSTPQVGYLARIDSDAEPETAQMPLANPDDPMAGQNLPDHHSVDAEEEARSLYLAAQEALHSASGPDAAYGASLLRQSADMGYAPAMTELGALYSFGRGLPRDDTAALEWQRRAAAQKNAQALFRLALIHSAGRGVPQNDRAAGDWMTRAALQGHTEAMFVLAMLHEDGVGVSESMVEMVRWLEAAAAQGHVVSMFFAGLIYAEGEDGVIMKDSQKSEQYLLAAAQAGHGGAMQALSQFYEGTSEQEARKWAEAAQRTPTEEIDMQDVQCLSDWECYFPEQSLSQAAVPSEVTQPERTVQVTYVVQGCDRLAATPRDDDRPDQALYVEYADLNAAQVISQCQEDIAEWPDTRRFYAQIARGYHKNGMHKEAFDAAMLGARMGSGQAMSFVGALYKSGGPVAQDAREALRWFEQAGGAGNITGMHFAAQMHLRGDGVPHDPQAAANWLKAAAERGSPPAYANLGVLYDQGQGVPYDPQEAAANLLIGLSTGAPLAREQLLENAATLTQQTRIAVQRILAADGLYTGAFDGDFGPQTKRALRARPMN